MYITQIYLLFYIGWSIVLSGEAAVSVRGCKLTQDGRDYAGSISISGSGRRCQFWETSFPVHQMSENISDADFPDGSRKLARNYCRNPAGERRKRGPWCYTTDREVPYEECYIPLCSLPECRVSGPGSEFSGKMKTAGPGESCSRWTDKELFPQGRFIDQSFPESSRRAVVKACRNPDGDPQGPWCPLDPGDGGAAKKGYCDVPLCDDVEWLEFTEDVGEDEEWTHFTRLVSQNESGAVSLNLSLGLRLWDPGSWSGADAHLLLSPVATPGTAKALGTGVGAVKFTIKTPRSGFEYGVRNDTWWERMGSPVAGGLQSTTDWPWLRLWLLFSADKVSVGLNGLDTPVATGLLSGELAKEFGLRHLSVAGTGLLWDIPFTFEECPVHSTSRLHFSRFLRLRAGEVGGARDVMLQVRARHTAAVQLRIAPAVRYPSLTLVLQRRSNNVTTLTLSELAANGSDVTRTAVQSKRTPGVLSMQKWQQFTISLFGSRLQLLWMRTWDTKSILDVELPLVRELRWFAPASHNSLAHWAFWCRPPDPPSAMPPDCLLSPTGETNYTGMQRSAESGAPCLPWAAVPASHLGAAELDLCRNLEGGPQGPWCYTGRLGSVRPPRKERCDVPICMSVECRLAGTGNDFIGRLNVTRTGRTCQRWLSNQPHKVNASYLNESLYAERSLEEASNFCRDPSHNIGGPWCYTTDPDLARDLCHAYDCAMPEGCTMLTQGVGTGRDLLILPRWRTRGVHFWLKEWDPELADGIIWLLWKDATGNGTRLRLKLGADNNEKIALSLVKEGYELVLHQETHPHFILVGQWTGLWLKMLPSGGVQVGRHESRDALFSWEPEGLGLAGFTPQRLSFSSILGHTIGVSFPCDECHVEVTTTRRYTKVLPLTLWRRDPLEGAPGSLTIYGRGSGAALVALIRQPGEGDYHAVTLGEGPGKDRIYLLRQKEGALSEIDKVRLPQRIFYEDRWTKVNIKWTETRMRVWWNNLLFLETDVKERLVFYFFSLSSQDGSIMWTANCEPPDVEHQGVDGGWSAWSPPTSCSATCGGGWGRRIRTCTNPTPTIGGHDCEGEEYVEEACNTFPCGQITPDTEAAVLKGLRRRHASTEAAEGDRVFLQCADLSLLATIMKEAPETSLTWQHDGRDINVATAGYELELPAVEAADSGVYACFAVTPGRVNPLPLAAQSLAVRPVESAHVRATRMLPMRCKAGALGGLYKGLFVVWRGGAGGNRLIRLGRVDPAAVETVEMEAIPVMTGDWKCIVLQPQLKLRWTTNWIKLKVDSSPTVLNRLADDLGISESLASAMVVAVVVVTVLLAYAGALAYLRWCTLPLPE